MQEIIAQALVYLHGAWRFKWHAMFVAWGVALAGWVAVYGMPDSYQSRARVFVDTDTILKPLLNGLAVNTDVVSEINAMATVLLSRPHLEEVARKSELYRRAETPEAFESLVRQLPARIALGGGRDGTYTLTYEDSDPVMAQRVVQTLLDTFLTDARGHTRADSNDARRFLEQQIKEYARRLTAAEDSLAQFKQKNVGTMPGQTGDYYTRLQAAVQSQEELRSKYRLASDRRAELEKQLGGEEPTFGLGGTSRVGTSPYDVKIAEAQKRLDTLLVQFTEKHPEVLRLRETIDRLEQQKKAQEPIAATPEQVDPTRLALRALDINPVYQSMKIALSQTNVELAELKSQMAGADRAVADLRSRVDTIPEVEAQLARLNRDYEVNKAQHTALVQRLESARLSNDAQNEGGSSNLKVIENPTVPLQPIAPNRPLFLTVVLLLALAAGAGVAVFMDQRAPIFGTRNVLRTVTGLPVLGAIHRVVSPKEQAEERRQRWLIAGAAASLALAYVCSLLLIRTLGPVTRALLG